MKELLRRLRLRPVLTIEILVASFFVNLLSLASTVYVILVLSRYVGYGFDGTLITLTAGVILASVVSYGFSIARGKLASAISTEPDMELSSKVLDTLARAKASHLTSVAPARVQEILAGLQIVQSAYDRNHIIAAVDAPFFVLFIGAIFILSPTLAILTLAGIGFVVLNGVVTLKRNRAAALTLQEETVVHRGLVASAVTGADTVRAYLGKSFLKRKWDEQLERIGRLQQTLADKQLYSRTLTGSIGQLLRIGVYAMGAKLVVGGDINVSVLIGVSILSAKALQVVSSFMQTRFVLQRAEEKMAGLEEFMTLPLEAESGTAPSEFQGRLEFKDLGFAYPRSTGPLFESLSLKLPPGSILVVRGYNGSGKTTLARLCAGLLEPVRGQILADGVDIRQLDPAWWRKQVVYLPQEPTFLNTTIRENILMAAPDIEEERLAAILQMAELRRFLDTSKDGLEMPVVDSGRNLSLGIRRRLALARALVTGGRLAVLDEPTEGLDGHGCAAVYSVLNMLASGGTTIIAFTNDPNILKGARLVMDLSEKPTPKVMQNQGGQNQGGQGQAAPAPGPGASGSTGTQGATGPSDAAGSDATDESGGKPSGSNGNNGGAA